MSIDAAKEIYEHIELFGKPALFSNFRIDYTIYHILFFIKTTLCLYEVVQQAGALLHHLYIFWKFYFLIF